MSVEFDTNIPERDPGCWGLKINGGPVEEVIWCEKKPMATMFSRGRPKGFGEPYPNIESLHVVKVEVVESGQPALLARDWHKD